MLSHLFGILTRNLGLKLLALLLALVVYGHVVTDQEQEWQLRTPLRIVGLPRTLVIDEPPPEAVEISARGTGKQLLRLRVSAPEMLLDLSRVGPGRVQRILSPADVALPVGTDVAVTEILDPRMVSLTVDTLLTRAMPVSVSSVGALPRGLALLGPPVAIPANVVVTAPSRLIDRVELSVEPLDLELLARIHEVRLRVQASPPEASVEPVSVGVMAEVAPLVERDFPSLAVQLENLPAGLLARLDPESVAVALSGPAPVLRDLPADSVRVVLDVGDLGAGRHLLIPGVRFGEGVFRVESIRPPRVFVEIVPETPLEP